MITPLYTSEREKEVGRRTQQLQIGIALACGWLPGHSATLSPPLLSRVGRKYHKTALRLRHGDHSPATIMGKRQELRKIISFSIKNTVG